MMGGREIWILDKLKERLRGDIAAWRLLLKRGLSAIDVGKYEYAIEYAEEILDFLKEKERT